MSTSYEEQMQEREEMFEEECQENIREHPSNSSDRGNYNSSSGLPDTGTSDRELGNTIRELIMPAPNNPINMLRAMTAVIESYTDHCADDPGFENQLQDNLDWIFSRYTQ